MEHDEMVALIRGGVGAPGGVWADLGAGTGNFTRALAALIGPGAAIHALDRDGRAVASLQRLAAEAPGGATILPRQADVARPLDLPPLDGALLANLLHFLRDQEATLARAAALLKPGGRLLLVEYDLNLPMPWVPHPVPQTRALQLLRTAGMEAEEVVGTRRSPSSGRVMYAAAGRRPRHAPGG